MVTAKRGVGTTDVISGIVHALEHRFRGRYIRTPPYYEANPLSVLHRLAPRCANTVRHYFKKIYESQGVLKGGTNIQPKSSLEVCVCLFVCLLCVLLCFIQPVLGNHYNPWVSLSLSLDRFETT